MKNHVACRHLPVLASCLCMAMAGSAVAQGEPQPPSTEGGGIWLGPLNISPFLNLMGLYDSNVNIVRDGEKKRLKEIRGDDDTESGGYSVQPGIDLLLPGNNWQLSGTAYYRLEDYEEDFAETRHDWHEALSLYGETEGGLGLRLSEMVQQVAVDEKDYAGRWHDRREMRFGADIGKPLTDKTKLGLSGFYSDTDYDDDTLFDSDRWGGTLTLATRLTDKTDGLLVGGITTHSADDQKGHAESYIINAGVASRATDKIAYRMTAGVEIYTGFDDQDTEVGFSYDLGGFWRATEKLTLSLSGRSAYEPAEDVGQNSMLVSTVGLKADYRPLTRWQFTLGGAYRREDYVDNIVVNNAAVQTVADGGEDRTDDQLCGHAQVVFGLNKYASLFANGIYTYTTSSIDDLDYDRWRVTAGVALRY